MALNVTLRKYDLCPVFGSARELPTNFLPSYEDVMKYYLWITRFNCTNKNKIKDLVRNTCEVVALKVEDVWKKSSIPIIEHRVVVKRVREYHEKYRSLLKPYKARKNVDSYKLKLQEFRDKSKLLFDIATCKCANQNSCSCERTRKIPIKERIFLNDQRGERIMIIGGIDKSASKKQLLLCERKRKREEYQINMKTSNLPIVDSSTDNTSTSSEKVSVESIFTEHPSYEGMKELNENKITLLQGEQVKKKYPIVARVLDRYGISDRAGAAIVSATLQDIGVINENSCSNVVDRSKIRRARANKRKDLSLASHSIVTECNTFGLYFDGRKDKTLVMNDNRRKVIVEEHISLIKEPGSMYLGHISLSSGTARAIKNGILDFISKNSIDPQKIRAIGCDGTVTNTGQKGGAIRLMELEFNRPMQWFICQLHANELPLRHLFEYLDGATSGPRCFAGSIGKQLTKCEDLPVVKFKQMECNLPEFETNLSTDQQYLLDICRAIHSGICSESLAKRSPGKMVHSRWLTTANRVLRLYVSSLEPSANLIALVSYILKVYAPVWFQIKRNSSCIDGPNNICQLIILSRYLPDELKQIVDPVIQRNGFFVHRENILLAMIHDNRLNIRELALRRILRARQLENNSSIRIFTLPKINFSAKDYINLIDWQSCEITEPPLTKLLSEDIILKSIEEKDINPNKLLPEVALLPCHTQAVERSVKTVTEASLAVCGSSNRDGFIRARNESRKIMPVFDTKKEYITN